jgi:hypothetical protein
MITWMFPPFAKPAPARCIGLVWRKSIARTQAIEALASAVAQAKIAGIEHLT